SGLPQPGPPRRQREVDLSKGVIDRRPKPDLARSLGEPERRPEETIMTKNADFKRRVRARMAKTGESYSTARAQLLGALEPLAGALHITNGDSAAGTLRHTSVANRVLAWRDVLHEGPVPAVDDVELRRTRAEFLAEVASADAAATRRSLQQRDEALAANAGAPYVLWF